MDRLGIAPVPSIPEHPVDEALFNFALAWSLMVGPLMLLDPRVQHIRNRTRWLLWTGTMVCAAGSQPATGLRVATALSASYMNLLLAVAPVARVLLLTRRGLLLRSS